MKHKEDQLKSSKILLQKKERERERNGVGRDERAGDKGVGDVLCHAGQRAATHGRGLAKRFQEVNARLVHHRSNIAHEQERAGAFFCRPNDSHQNTAQLSRAASGQSRG